MHLELHLTTKDLEKCMRSFLANDEEMGLSHLPVRGIEFRMGTLPTDSMDCVVHFKDPLDKP